MNPSSYAPDAPRAPRISLPDIVCLSHLRWDFVTQRPQHLLSRAAKETRVFFVEEPCYSEEIARLEISTREDGLYVVVPHLPWTVEDSEAEQQQQEILDRLLKEQQIEEYVLWYYTPMAIGFSRHLSPAVTVYDCMDELSAFHGASPQLLRREAELLERADLVFTGGQSLYEAKRDRHPSVHAFPSSIDRAHFASARQPQKEPVEQASIPHPRLGFFGVVDERMDLELLHGVAEARPDWHLVIIGPVVKIDPTTLPQRENIHYLGGKDYRWLPAFLAGWDVAIMPFARNEATRFISPTKTPEYLAGGKPVVSTSIRDVIRPYGEEKLVRIADTPEEFVDAVQAAMREDNEESGWLARVDERLAQTSWDQTWNGMKQLIENVLHQNQVAAQRVAGD